jgi:hypothetical protein
MVFPMAISPFLKNIKNSKELWVKDLQNVCNP